MIFFLVFFSIGLNYGFGENCPSLQNPSKNTKLDKSMCVCRLGASERIVNGEVAEPNLIPWKVSLAFSGNNEHFCGATIINQNYILTAGHCVHNLKKDQIKVRVGLHELDVPNRILETKTYYVEEIISDLFTDFTNPGDIALLRLEKEIKFIKGEVEPACLNFIKKDYTEKLMIAGWGETVIAKKNFITNKRSRALTSPVLKKAYLNTFTKGCKEFEICLNSDESAAVCYGDSGSPLHFIENGFATVEGINSNIASKTKIGDDVILCSTEGYSYNSRLSYYKKWFEDHIGDDYCTLKFIYKLFYRFLVLSSLN